MKNEKSSSTASAMTLDGTIINGSSGATFGEWMIKRYGICVMMKDKDGILILGV